jgi:hypothetical protein
MSDQQDRESTPPNPTDKPEATSPVTSQAEPPPDTAWVSFDSIVGSGAPLDE